MRNQKRICALLLALCLLHSLALSAGAAPEKDAAGEAVVISSVEDFLAFARNCSLDAWSRGKTFRLTADLDLTGAEFSPVPTFGGTFLGEGHTVSGLSVTAAGSHMGLFRFVQAGAVIRDLKVAGRVVPGGSAADVGGIAGNNAGSLQNCSFEGTVEGKTNVGGIVGQNDTAGEVSGCSAAGALTGETCTGGIAGKNLGVLLSCESSADVNTSDPDAAAGAVTGSTLDQLTAPNAGEEADALLNSHTDSGGIAGYSSGVIQSCANTGTVGYSHVGYNVGGVAGRQAGYMSGCSNSGTVLGRKDVGGIVGQAEPDIFLNTDGDTLAQLRQELNTLNTMVNQALDRSDASRADISAKLSAMGNAAGEARDSAKTLLDHVSDFTDGNLETLNTLGSAVTAALEGLDPALDSLSAAAGSLGTMGTQLDTALDTLAAAGQLTDAVLEKAKGAAADLGGAADDLEDAARDLRRAADELKDAVIVHDHAAVKRANSELATSIKALGASLHDAHTAMTTLRDALNTLEPGGIAGPLGDLGDAIGGAGDALDGIGTALGTISDNIEINWDDVQAGLDAAGSGLDSLGDAAGHISDASKDLEKAMDAAGPLADSLGDAAGQLSDAAASGGDAGNSLRDAFDTLREVAGQLSRDGDVQLTPLGQPVRDAGDSLYSSLSSLSGNLTDLQNSVDSAGDVLTADLRAISRQMNKVFTLMLDTLDSAQTVTAPEDIFGDVSEENIDNTRLGKAASCTNTGTVEGDRNVGGVAGAVAVEYSLDPEDDVSRLTFGRTYELKAILQNCVNRGEVAGKRDCVGGVAGRMDLGTAIGCQGYGPVSSEGGYVGGVAGYADAAVRDCWAKCALSGTEYVGGVAGWASRMTGCRAIATILDGSEFVGSIAGDADREGGGLEDNRFVDLGTAGIDGVSYAGIAEPVPYDQLCGEENVPAEFLSFTLTLTAEGRTVAQLPFRYGDDLSRLELPPVPVKEGYYGTWPAFDQSGLRSDLTLEAVYSPWVTLVAGGEGEDGLALALAEGQFTQEAVLTVTDSKTPPPKGAGEEASVWDVSLTGADLDGTASVPLRLLNRGGKRAAVWQYRDGRWQEVKATVNGSYLCLTMDGTSGTFCVLPDAGALPSVALPVAGATLLAAVFLMGRARRKKRVPSA